MSSSSASLGTPIIKAEMEFNNENELLGIPEYTTTAAPFGYNITHLTDPFAGAALGGMGDFHSQYNAPGFRSFSPYPLALEAPASNNSLSFGGAKLPDWRVNNTYAPQQSLATLNPLSIMRTPLSTSPSAINHKTIGAEHEEVSDWSNASAFFEQDSDGTRDSTIFSSPAAPVGDHGEDGVVSGDQDANSEATSKDSDVESSSAYGDASNIDIDTVMAPDVPLRLQKVIIVKMKRAGYAYKDIKRIRKFTMAESTMRGHYRNAIKPASQRPRKQTWIKLDEALLRRALIIYPKPANAGVKYKIPWAKISNWMFINGSSLSFSTSTLKKMHKQIKP